MKYEVETTQGEVFVKSSLRTLAVAHLFLFWRSFCSMAFVLFCTYQFSYAQANDTTSICCKHIRISGETNMDSLGFYFRMLRPYKANECCKDYLGSFSCIMHAIADSLNEFSKTGKYIHVNRLHELLGMEDKRFSSPQNIPTPYHGMKVNGNTEKEYFETLHYYWRGTHDYLMFFVKNDQIMFCQWIYKLE